MKKFHSGVPLPRKTISIINKSAKLTQRQSTFAKKEARVVNRVFTFDKK